MVIDYKNVGFSFKEKKRKKRLKRLKLISLLLVVAGIVLFIVNSQQVKKMERVQSLLLNQQKEAALETWNSLKNALFYKKTIYELRALIHFFYRNPEEARNWLKRVKKSRTRVQYRRFLEHFTDKAQYLALKIYTDFLLNRGEKVHFHRALYQTARFQPAKSEASLARLSPEEKNGQAKSIAILHELNSQLKSGSVNFVFDKNGRPLARYNFRKKTVVSLVPGIGFHRFAEFLKSGVKRYSLTIDNGIQKAIHRLFRKYHGSMLLFKLEDSSILAAYSKPLEKNPLAVFNEPYEPGSIIKVLTLFSYYTGSAKNLFPFQCESGIVLNNRLFPDRIAHGLIKDPKEALSVSCNIAFARMGLAVGSKSLGRTLDSFYFNSKGFKDVFLEFKTGSYNQRIAGDYALANLSVGLNEIRITTFHSALLALILAQDGSIYRPHMINNIKNILNLGYYTHRPEIIRVTENHPAYVKIKQAMVDVVENPQGTGRHAGVDFVKTAIKTGTAGNKRLGLDAIILGFFPAEKPEYAFAFRLQRAGKAEVEGAAFLRNFLTRFYRNRTQ